MRQLKGKVKENAKEKRERKKEFMENKENAFRIALPFIGAAFVLICVMVYMATRPKPVVE